MLRRSAFPRPGPAATETRRSTSFLLILALGYAGGVIGYLPLLTLLLPLKVGTIAGAGRLGVLAIIVIAGAIAASLANIGFGWLSDRSIGRGGRRSWVAGGIGATALTYGAVALAASPVQLVLAVIAFQIAVNALLAPLLAIMADEVPPTQRGLAGGLLALANPVASALAAGLIALDAVNETSRLAIVPLLVAVCTIPLVLTRARPTSRTEPPVVSKTVLRHDLVLAWVARLCVQVAGSALFIYLLYYLQSVAPGVEPRRIAARMGMVMIAAYGMPLPIAVLVGRLADRIGRIKPFLFAAAVIAAVGLVGMAFADDFTTGAFAFCVYTTGASVFLALHTGFAMQLLPDARHRGRDLGVLNLANTLPALLGAMLTWAFATPIEYDGVMLVLAALTLSGGFIILGARGYR